MHHINLKTRVYRTRQGAFGGKVYDKGQYDEVMPMTFDNRGEAEKYLRAFAQGIAWSLNATTVSIDDKEIVVKI